MSLPFDIVALVSGAALGGLAVYGLMTGRTSRLQGLLDAERQSAADRFRALSADALRANNEQFLALARENLGAFQQHANASLAEREKAIQQLVAPVSETLQKMDGKIAELEQKRAGAYGELIQLVNNMRDQHVQLQNQTSTLVQTLRAPTTRGHYGETQLKTILDFANLVEGVHYSRQVSAEGMRPDVVVNLPPDKVVLIDAKVPMQNYQQAMQPGVSDADKNVFLEKHAADVRLHIKKLSDKDYTKNFNSFDWVVMFLPLEGLIQMAMDKQPDLMEFAWKQNVILATPMNLLALMRTVSYAHDQFKVNENAREISKIGEVLYQRVFIFAEHFEKIGRGMTTAMKSYNDAVGSFERNVLPALNKMKDAGIKADDRGVALNTLDQAPARLTVVDPDKDVA